MPLAIVCPACNAGYTLADNVRGKNVRCSRCQRIFVAGTPLRGVPAALPQRPRRSPVGTPPPGYLPAPMQPQSSGIPVALIAGTAVAAVFALILVGGIAIILWQKPHPVQAPLPRPGAVAEVKQPTGNEPSATQLVKDPAPREQPVKEPIVLDPPKDPPPGTVNSDGSLAPAVLQRVKRATVYLRVTVADGSVNQGSGFFAVEPGIILTNAHVLGMLTGKNRKPLRIEVVLNSGQPDERTLPGQIVEVDRNTDLAVLYVVGKNLPDPLAVYSTKDLQETQQVYVCGFPFGVNLGKEVSIRNSKVSSFRRDKDSGELRRVQLEGGMDPGNSGGPVIDTRGNVIGVAVAGIRSTTINFAIPGDRVQAILSGGASKISFGEPYREGETARLAVSIQVVDPLLRTRQVAIDVWTGNAGETRQASPSAPAAQPGDSARQQTMLTLQNGTASGEVTLPPLPAGMVYWFQPVSISAANQPQWLAATAMNSPSPPLDRRPATLAVSHKVGTLPVGLTRKGSYHLDAKGEEHTVVLSMDVQLAENTRAVDAQGTASIVLQYLKVNVGVTKGGQAPATNRLQQVLQSFLSMLSGELKVDRQGNVVLSRPDASKVPAEVRNSLSDVGDQVQVSLAALAIPLLGGKVVPGQSWTAQRVLPVDADGKYDAAVLEMKYTYLGVRAREGREEAVIALSGLVKPRQGSGQNVTGRSTGTAVVDVASGLVTSAATTLDIEDLLVDKAKITKAAGTLELHLQRGTAAK